MPRCRVHAERNCWQFCNRKAICVNPEKKRARQHGGRGGEGPGPGKEPHDSACRHEGVRAGTLAHGSRSPTKPRWVHS